MNNLPTPLSTSVLLLAGALSACILPKTEETTFDDEGEACLVRADSQPYEDVSVTLTPDDNLSIMVFFPVGCLSSSCSDIERAECEASVDGTTIEVTSSGLLVRDTAPRACTDDCGIMTATCSLPDLQEGTYTIVHGDETKEVELPGEPECSGAF